VGEGPRGRRAVEVLDRAEVLLSEARETRSVHLRVAADDVVHSGPERAAGAVQPPLRGAVAAVDEDGPRRPILRFARQALPPLQHEHVDASPRQRERGRPAAHARADDHDVRAERRHGYVTIATCTSPGPWTPTASFCSMSALRLGPVTIATELGRSVPSASKSSSSPATIVPSRTTV